ncbi:hypothetical protein V8C42DRAFT_335855 [Trichoderma barbatum]
MSKTAALVSEGKFAFTNGVFFAEASGHNQHRRATQEELRTHFASGSDKDYTAHWFEAQLIHYGLQPSKVKSVARMRLFDAVREGALSVPSHITELEKKLKKEWTKQDREDKKAAKAGGSTVVPKVEASKKSTTRKRKADVTVNVTINATQLGIATSSVPTTKASKRSKTSASLQNSSTPTPRSTAKQTARRGGSSRASSRPQPATRALPAPTPASAPRPKQMARRGALSAQRARAQPSHARSDGYSAYSDSFDEPPPPYDDDSEDNSRFEETASLSPLGLLNGRYDISCPFVESEWPRYASGFRLVLTIAGSSLWGKFDLGIIEGVVYFEERPRSSSFDSIPFHWRGREADGPISYDDENNEGWIRFLGDGRIEGWIDFQGIHFEGQRLPEQGTRSEMDASILQDEWEEYNEYEYEREERERW